MQPETIKALVPISMVVGGTVLAIAAAFSPHLSDTGRATLAGTAAVAFSGAAGITNFDKDRNKDRQNPN